MNDLQICKRIADIEDKNTIVCDGKLIHVKDVALTMNGKKYHELNRAARYFYNSKNEFNPLTDDALCFQLMKKYKIDINNDEDHNLCTAWYAEYKSVQDEDMNKAILLAIIEAHND